MSGRIVRTEVLRKGYITLRKVVLEEPDGAEVDRELTDHGQAVAFLPYDAERRVALLVTMPRTPVIYAGMTEDLLEAPAGMIEGQDAADDTARREAMEEVGVKLTALEHVLHGWPSPGTSTERVQLYLAPFTAADRVAGGGGAEGEHENITVRELPLCDLAVMVDSGRLTDMKTALLVLALRSRRPELFA
ncbi:MAG: NUDIX hydrolase [Acetobacteraceae bacterium]|nr:NUDIX hydrolase [Acetobacteraceae bacterium]